ncbi:L,D-transpeptidase [Streptomyces sp. NBC_00878]|uniref:L,D-transpeptidase n=1 Tax=Streptomyces sp. NBC_00878 TaxID=2975854 RepID=UPI00225912E1|nr:L,D-transpeptidase [Streptomyces sp. NBC_00878]MCX4907303.1 L,D-transpeptidase [Streptomyces sp. NBC_00878]
MSDELKPGAAHGADGPDGWSVGSELAISLRELAHDHEMPVPVPGAEIRRRAVRRRRRRQASFAAVGASAATALALVLTVALTGGREPRTTSPAASYAGPTASASAPPSAAKAGPAEVAATVDLGRREMTVEGRTLAISSGSPKSPTPTGLMTVTEKYEAAMVPAAEAGWNGYDVKAPWVMTLRTPDNRTNYLLALTWDEKAPGNYDITGGAIGLRYDEAMWLYKVLKPGSRVDVVGAAPTASDDATR